MNTDFLPTIFCNNESLYPTIHKILAKFQLNDIHIEPTITHQIDLGLTCPGTTTLNLALKKIPMIVFGQLHWLSYFIAKYVYRIILKFVALHNLILDRKVCPEYIQNKSPISAIVSDIQSLLNDTTRREKMLADFQSINDQISQSHPISNLLVQ